MRRVFVAGGFVSAFIGKGHPNFIHPKHPEFGKKTNPTLEDYVSMAVNESLKDANVDPAVVDRLAIGNFCGELFCNQGHLGAAVIGANKALMYKPCMRVEGACASGALAVQVCYDAIKAGSDVALAVGAEVQTTQPARVGGDYLARAAHYSRQRKIDDFTFPCLFAKRMKAIQEAGLFTMEDAAHVAAKAYANGNLNPKAHMTKVKMPFEAANTPSDKNPLFLSNAEYKNFLRVSDCSQVSDGASGIVLLSEEGVMKTGRNLSDCIEIIGLGSSVGNLYEDSDPTKMETSASAAAKAYEAAKIKPTDLNVIELHDCFTIAELLEYEALQLAEYGHAKELILSGATTRDGRFPVNTGGGLISCGHPVGATGVKQIFEVYKQMKRRAEKYQLRDIPEFGATLNMGGDDKTAVCTILKNIS